MGSTFKQRWDFVSDGEVATVRQQLLQLLKASGRSALPGGVHAGMVASLGKDDLLDLAHHLNGKADELQELYGGSLASIGGIIAKRQSWQ